MRRLLIACSLATVTAHVLAQGLPQMGSSSVIWAQRAATEKTTYLEGVCDGLGTSQQSALGALFCSESHVPLKARFCGLVNTENGKDAVAYVDRFYRNRKQSDIPIWAVIGTYNDSACAEDTVTSRLPKMQKLIECGRQAVNMIQSQGVSSEAIKAQQEYCRSLNK